METLQQDHWQFKSTDWLIRIDSNASNSVRLVSCTDHVERAFLREFSKDEAQTRRRYMGTSLIDQMLVFLR